MIKNEAKMKDKTLSEKLLKKFNEFRKQEKFVRYVHKSIALHIYLSGAEDVLNLMKEMK